MAYKFLSDEWMDEAKKIREEYTGKTPPAAHAVKMNQIITDVPFGEGTIEAHMDTARRRAGDGHRATSTAPTLTVTLDYETAKAIFVEGNPQAGMQAFMAGKIKVQGDMTKLMAMQPAPPTPTAAGDRRARSRRSPSSSLGGVASSSAERGPARSRARRARSRARPRRVGARSTATNSAHTTPSAATTAPTR